MPTLLPFLIFSFVCVFVVPLLLILFKIGRTYARSIFMEGVLSS